MGARRFDDLIAWRLANELKESVIAFIAKQPACRDRDSCDQIRKSASSAPANVSEGFGRYYPREFARFLRIAIGSLQETLNHLEDAHKRGYLNDAEHDRLRRLCLRTIKAANRFIAYLLRAKPS